MRRSEKGERNTHLVRGRDELLSGDVGDLLRNTFGETNVGVKTSSNSSSSLSELRKTRKSSLHTRDTVLELGSISTKLLSEGKRGGILGVGTADLCIYVGREV